LEPCGKGEEREGTQGMRCGWPNDQLQVPPLKIFHNNKNKNGGRAHKIRNFEGEGQMGNNTRSFVDNVMNIIILQHDSI